MVSARTGKNSSKGILQPSTGEVLIQLDTSKLNKGSNMNFSPLGEKFKLTTTLNILPEFLFELNKIFVFSFSSS